MMNAGKYVVIMVIYLMIQWTVSSIFNIHMYIGCYWYQYNYYIKVKIHILSAFITPHGGKICSNHRLPLQVCIQIFPNVISFTALH